MIPLYYCEKRYSNITLKNNKLVHEDSRNETIDYHYYLLDMEKLKPSYLNHHNTVKAFTIQKLGQAFFNTLFIDIPYITCQTIKTTSKIKTLFNHYELSKDFINYLDIYDKYYFNYEFMYLEINLTLFNQKSK